MKRKIYLRDLIPNYPRKTTAPLALLLIRSLKIKQYNCLLQSINLLNNFIMRIKFHPHHPALLSNTTR